MMRLRTVLMSLVAVFAVSAVASATAQAECSGTAPEHKCLWEIKETVGGAFEPLGSAEEEFNTFGSEASAFKLVAGAKEIKCTEVAMLNVLAGGKPGGDFADKILLKGCTTTEAECKVKSKGNTKSGEILITNIRSKLVEREKGTEKNILSDNFSEKPRRGRKEWVEFEFGKEEKLEEAGTRFEHRKLATACAGYVNTKVKGSMAAKVEAEKLNFPTPELSGNTLEAFGVALKLVGTIKLPMEEPGEYRAS